MEQDINNKAKIKGIDLQPFWPIKVKITGQDGRMKMIFCEKQNQGKHLTCDFRASDQGVIIDLHESDEILKAKKLDYWKPQNRIEIPGTAFGELEIQMKKLGKGIIPRRLYSLNGIKNRGWVFQRKDKLSNLFEPGPGKILRTKPIEELIQYLSNCMLSSEKLASDKGQKYLVWRPSKGLKVAKVLGLLIKVQSKKPRFMVFSQSRLFKFVEISKNYEVN